MANNNKLLLLLLVVAVGYYILNEQSKNTSSTTQKEEDKDCEVSEWSEWGPCASGKQSRTRTVRQEKSGNGKDCPVLSEEQSCSLWSSLKNRISGKSNEDWASWIYNSIIGTPRYDDRQTGVVNFAGEISGTDVLNKQQADSVCANVCWWHYNVFQKTK